MAQQLNCPNCGAPLGLSDKCPYCGTWFADFTIDRDKPFYIKIRVGDKILIDRVMLSSAYSETSGNPIYAEDFNGRPVMVYSTPETVYKMEFISMGVKD